MNDYKTDYTPYLLQTQTDARGQKIADFIVPLGSLRDQFAMAALFGVNTKEFDPKEIASKAFAIADAMMEARK